LGFGGAERVFLSVADHLSSNYGWTIHFVVDKLNGHETESVAQKSGYKVIGLEATRTWRSIVPFFRYLKNNKPNLVFTAYTETNAAALLSNGLDFFRTPVVVTEHASLDEHWARKSFPRKLMLEFIVRRIYRYADQVICVSKGMSDQVSRRLKHTCIGYIHNPVRFAIRSHTQCEARHALGVGTDVRMILAVGRIAIQKNYLMLLNAFNLIKYDEHSHLYIVGGVYEVDEKQRLDSFIAANALEGRVHFIDFTHDIAPYYEAADLLVLSSAWEGFGNVLVEALAFGLPIVSTRCNFGPSEILEDGKYGVLVEVNDHDAMSNAIRHVLTNNPFVPEQQILRAAMFSEQRVGDSYYKLICQTIKSRKQS
jgi:glycosyltransferase involved in cell wall biosynthesis